MPRTEEDVLVRLKRKTIYEDDHFIFVGKTIGRDNLYGGIWYKGKVIGVSRLICHLYHNADLEDNNWVACHRCKRTMCWNPDHLYVGTVYENVQDQLEAGTHYHKGRPRKHADNG